MHPSMLRQPKQLKSDFTRTRTTATVNHLRQLLLTLLTLYLLGGAKRLDPGNGDGTAVSHRFQGALPAHGGAATAW